MQSIRQIFAVAIGASLIVCYGAANAQTTVTSFAPASNTTSGVWYENDVRIGGTASIAELTGIGGDLENNQPLPNGAAKITTDFTNAAKAEVGVANNFGMPSVMFSTISITYSYHKATNAGQNPAAAPSLKLEFFNPVCDETIGGDCFATLVYEPTWNGPTSTSSTPVSSNPPVDTWTTVNINQNSGLFWTTGGFGAPNTAGGPPIKTLGQWLSALTPDFGDAFLTKVSIGVGSFNQGQIGYFDDVRISGTNADATYDFDPAPNFETVGECISTLIADDCTSLMGRARATCNHESQMTCFDIFGVK